MPRPAHFEDSDVRVEKLVVGESAQKTDYIEEVRFADAVRSGDTGEGPKAHVYIDEILESCDFETREQGYTDFCQHVSRIYSKGPLSAFAASLHFAAVVQ